MTMVGVAVVFSLIFTIPTGIVLAATSSPKATPGAGVAQLSQAYQHEQQVLTQQQTHLANTANVVTKIQALISKAQAKGLDTSALSTALATFQNQVAAATSSNKTAAGILSAHNGFDGSGNVTDPAAAHQTVLDARQNLQDARNTLKQAVSDIHTALKAWMEANKDKLQDQNLQKDYQNEQKWLTTQQGNLGKTSEVVTKVQNLISQAQTKGKDTSALSTALATFQSEIATANTSDTTAAGILSSHHGFDGSGNVTDQSAASQTVKDAHQSLSVARTALMQANSDLRNAIDQWRKSNQPTAVPVSTPTSG
jgi:RNA polymerase-interacting CarD/CdnL/TRCF family regulator